MFVSLLLGGVEDELLIFSARSLNQLRNCREQSGIKRGIEAIAFFNSLDNSSYIRIPFSCTQTVHRTFNLPCTYL
ncbi:MAG: hypothetical protein J7647_27060 [Cyanobacteria bacterium SBLK]|nr:hypothetical protein [Cyanobacteria bacterium SBLK]